MRVSEGEGGVGGRTEAEEFALRPPSQVIQQRLERPGVTPDRRPADVQRPVVIPTTAAQERAGGAAQGARRHHEDPEAGAGALLLARHQQPDQDDGGQLRRVPGGAREPAARVGPELSAAGAPWEVIATDPFEFGGKDFLLVTDVLSGYPFVVKMGDKTTRTILRALEELFLAYGFPREIISDTGGSS
jgi:hypothetical protein